MYSCVLLLNEHSKLVLKFAHMQVCLESMPIRTPTSTNPYARMHIKNARNTCTRQTRSVFHPERLTHSIVPSPKLLSATLPAYDSTGLATPATNRDKQSACMCELTRVHASMRLQILRCMYSYDSHSSVWPIAVCVSCVCMRTGGHEHSTTCL